MTVGETHGRRISRARSQVERERETGGSTHNWPYCTCICYAVLLRSLAALVTVKGNFSLCYRAMRWIDADELMGFLPESYWIPF
ncbi:unnamed protein product [Musa acuminata subsp. malaccensis]|uniref:(wild Malaysian banana) hypothetical protein n=1 Tax=Musa acuminata subsp. malaccensis TaxID=214687 RepID=A0A804IRN6_MUSAM|nr:unnamed protein product [Musa acuminata subsp. malaccensis]